MLQCSLCLVLSAIDYKLVAGLYCCNFVILAEYVLQLLPLCEWYNYDIIDVMC